MRLHVTDARDERASLPHQLVHPLLHNSGVGIGTERQFVHAETTHPAQDVVCFISCPRTADRDALQFQFEVGQHVGIEKFTQFLGAEQRVEQVAVE